MAARLIALLISTFISFNLFALKFETVGNKKTHQQVIDNELKDLKNAAVDDKLVVEVKRRLWNLRIFSKVKIEIVSDKKLIIKVEERWTLIPIAKATSGGGTTYFALGAYDINSFGINTELGAQYEQLNNRNAGVVWIRKPQFLHNRNLKFGADLWSINRIRYFFQDDSELDGAFTLERKRMNSFVEYKWNEDFMTLGFQLDYHQDETSDFGLDDELIEQNSANDYDPDESLISTWYGLYYLLGRLDYKNYLISGKQLKLTSFLVSISESSERYLTDSQIKFSYYKIFQDNLNFACQFVYNQTNLEQIQYQKYIGGFAEVRGYMDGQYYDKANWQNNIEQRFDLIEKSYGVLQGVVFTDQAKEGSDFKNITESKSEVLLSSGVGVRFISPKIYRFVGRLDYAQTHTRNASRGISFGIQQFF